MAENRDTPPPSQESDLEREIRSGREFSLAEALGRMGGGEMLKGASAISRERQAELAIDDYLRRHLTDPGGVLIIVLLRDLGEILLRRDYTQPLVVLADYVEGLLESEAPLEILVRSLDVEWGRVQGERPHFQKTEGAPDPDDPYTVESVRATLSKVLRALAAGEA